MDVQVEAEGNKAIVTIPSLNFHDFDRTGKVNVRSIQKLLTVARFIAYHTPNPQTGSCFLQYDKVTSDRFTFMASTATSFDEELFKLTRKSVVPSYKVSLRLGYVGKSSLNSIAELYCSDTGKVYATNTNQVVMVDKTTRKPTTIPDWWKDQYQPLVPDGKALIVPIIPLPDSTHQYDVKVPWTDIDNYKHTNYVSYIRFCQDAALDATFADYFSKVQGDFLQYRVQKMAICYKGESKANDLLTVHVWENAENPYQLHFSIELKNSTIFQNTITLFESDGSRV